MRVSLVAGLACLALSVLAILFARDVWHVDKALRDGDARAVTGDLSVKAWESDQLLPFGLAEHALDVSDDLEYRRTVGAAIPHARVVATTAKELRVRVGIEAELSRIATSRDRRRAAEAANLLGLMLLTDPSDPNSPLESPAQKAVREFRFATITDPTNDDAKANLEALLQNAKGKSISGRQDPGGGNQAGQGAAGLGVPGNGF